jgi:hypothetical protein
LLAAAAAALVAVGPGDADQPPDAARALDAYAAMGRFFHHGRVWSETSERRGWRPAAAWPFSQALAATIAIAHVDGSRGADVGERLLELRRYWNAGSAPPAYDSQPGGRQFYDDNEWIGIDLVAAHRLLGRPQALARASRLFRLVVSGWDARSDHACPGGVFWARAERPDHRNTVSTANGALLGLLLYRETRGAGYLRWATRMYAWVYRCLGAPNGLFWDHLDSQGRVEPTQWSYNQGAMIAAGALLYEATGDVAYLRRAEAVADAAAGRFAATLDQEPPYFLAIFFDDLLLLDLLDPARSYVDLVRAYADRIWVERRDPRTGLFRFAPGQPGQLLQQAAIVRIYAWLAAGAPW